MLDYRSVVTQDLLRQDIHLLENSSNQLCIPSIHRLGLVSPSIPASSKQHSGACSTEAKRHRNETSTEKSQQPGVFGRVATHLEKLTWEPENYLLGKGETSTNLQFLGFHVGFWECKLKPCVVFFRRFASGISLIPHKHSNKHATDLSPVEIGPRIHEKKRLSHFIRFGWLEETRRSPVDTHPHNLNGFYTSQVVVWDF